MSCSKPVHLKDADVFKIYKAAYKTRIPWDEILDEEVLSWLVIYEKAKNASLTLVMSVLLALIPALCGPNAKVATNDGNFETSLNTYIWAICDPGGGKSTTFERVLDPVLAYFSETTGHKLDIENYTIAGIQNHQHKNGGYGLLVSDEGGRLMNHWKLKQQKGESEVPLLCKLWGGKGDSSTLAAGNRGFNRTSFSMCLAIQPEPLMQNLQSLNGNNGYMERMLFLTAKPQMHGTKAMREFNTIFQEGRMIDFTAAMQYIHELHKAGAKTYKLSTEAQAVYDQLVDEYAEFINAKYNSDSGVSR